MPENTKRDTRKRLRTGFTTGAAAAAAAKAALLMYFDGKAPEAVSISLLTGDNITVSVHRCDRNGDQIECTVIKDAGDDPDVTHKAEIGARVTLLPTGDRTEREPEITITGGEGVGRVTKPGLEVPPGEPAINPGPRTMIRAELSRVLDKRQKLAVVRVEVFVPRGVELAENTLNSRLGILGGISILGTTGLVRPMSHDAYIATIRSALGVAKATGNRRVVFTTGRRSERYSQALLTDLAEEAFIQIGDFFRVSLEAAAKNRFERITLAVFFGKAVKMAQGVAHTHAAKSRLTLDQLARWTRAVLADDELAESVSQANTARHALELLRPNHQQVAAKVGREMIRSAERFAGPGVTIDGLIFDYDGTIMFQTESNGGERTTCSR